MKHVIGTGIVNWEKRERVSDRYGSIYLSDAEDCLTSSIKVNDKIHGKYGKLITIVKETRKSDHIGDFARGFFPSTPNIGDEIELGRGVLFFEESSGRDYTIMTVGIKPFVDRRSDWLNPESLYKVHEQTVELIFDEFEVNKR